MLWMIIFALLGAAAGFLYAPKFVSGVDPKILAGAGAVAGLILGYMFSFWTLILLALGGAAYWYFTNHMQKS